MEKFAQGDIKILICTNIVESGLDIQNANTIIVQDVQQFGLAQLYQVLLFLVSSSFRFSKKSDTLRVTLKARFWKLLMADRNNFVHSEL